MSRGGTESRRRRIGRRGVVAFLGLAGVFLVAEQALVEKATLASADAEYARTVSKVRLSEGGLSADLLQERRALDLRWLRLGVLLGVGALALLASLLLALGVGEDPRRHGAALLTLALVPALAFGVVAPVLTLLFGGVLAQVPDRYFGAAPASAE
jgi:hypothetical protein